MLIILLGCTTSSDKSRIKSSDRIPINERFSYSAISKDDSIDFCIYMNDERVANMIVSTQSIISSVTAYNTHNDSNEVFHSASLTTEGTNIVFLKTDTEDDGIHYLFDVNGDGFIERRWISHKDKAIDECFKTSVTSRIERIQN